MYEEKLSEDTQEPSRLLCAQFEVRGTGHSGADREVSAKVHGTSFTVCVRPCYGASKWNERRQDCRSVSTMAQISPPYVPVTTVYFASKTANNHVPPYMPPPPIACLYRVFLQDISRFA